MQPRHFPGVIGGVGIGLSLANSSGVAIRSETTEHGRERGFSLLEILVSTAVIAILLAIAYPRLSSLLPGTRVDGAVRRLAVELQKSRLRAIAEGKCVRVTFDVVNAKYQSASKSGVIPCGTDGYTNDGGPRVIDDAGAIRVAATASPTFDPRGRTPTASVITLTATDGSSRIAAVNAVGQISVQ